MKPNQGKTRDLKPSAAGFILVDSSFKPIYSNTEVINILTYQERPQKIKSIEHFVTDKIRLALLNHGSHTQYPFLTELVSGKRRYLCCGFSLNSHSKNSIQSIKEILPNE